MFDQFLYKMFTESIGGRQLISWSKFVDADCRDITTIFVLLLYARIIGHCAFYYKQ